MRLGFLPCRTHHNSLRRGISDQLLNCLFSNRLLSLYYRHIIEKYQQNDGHCMSQANGFFACFYALAAIGNILRPSSRNLANEQSSHPKWFRDADDV
jgi:hypothetical protein